MGRISATVLESEVQEQARADLRRESAGHRWENQSPAIQSDLLWNARANLLSQAAERVDALGWQISEHPGDCHCSTTDLREQRATASARLAYFTGWFEGARQAKGEGKTDA